MENFQVTMEVQGHIHKGEYEKAFAVVLGASNLELLVWLCSKVEVAQLLGASPPPSQIILASLVQQLGFNLSQESELKLPWLFETLQHLQPEDPIIAPSVGRILHSIADNMRAVAVVLGQPTHPQHAQFQQVAAVLSKLIRPGAQ